MCSAALKELMNIVKDQIEERSLVVLVFDKASQVWKDASAKMLSRGDNKSGHKQQMRTNQE